MESAREPGSYEPNLFFYRTKSFRRLVAVSRFFFFPIQMNFAENKIRLTNVLRRKVGRKWVGGYMRGEQVLKQATNGQPLETCLQRLPPHCTIFFRHLLSGLLNRLAGSVLVSGRFIVNMSPPTKPAACSTAYWGCLGLQRVRSSVALDGFCGWLAAGYA
jgi:hypothetical protein